jgi:hypothetical protein
MTERLATTRDLLERVVHLIEQGEPGAAGERGDRNLIAASMAAQCRALTSVPTAISMSRTPTSGYSASSLT